MRINVASFGGRSHLLDTARELEKFGHEVRFYSYLPTKRTTKFGLKKECNYSLFYLAFPFVLFFKLFGHKEIVYHLYKVVFDYITAWIMKPCDVFIGQSPMHLYSLKYAKKKYGAITILERGTSHVLIQTQAIKDNPALKGKVSMKDWYIRHDQRGYECADFISVGASHVLDSFVAYGFDPKRIFVNNYGVSLSNFKPTELTFNEPYDIMIVGQWSYRKGCDLIMEAAERIGLKVLHVGSLTDLDFPQSVKFTHIDSVFEYDLRNYYSKSKIFVLPSREEGLSLVQAQALSCGLPLVCSPKSGGRDLRRYLENDKYIVEMESLSVEELIRCIKLALDVASAQKGERSCLKKYISDISFNISWDGYGYRYNQFLLNIKKK